jgi:hypothetical protein
VWQGNISGSSSAIIAAIAASVAGSNSDAAFLWLEVDFFDFFVADALGTLSSACNDSK